MKNWIKYLISTIVFGIVYTLALYLFTKNINLKLIILTTILYGITYTTVNTLYNNTRKNNDRLEK